MTRLAYREHSLAAVDASSVLGEQRVREFRKGRNFIRVGDTVHVNLSRPRKRDSFDSKVISIRARGDVITGVDVVDPRSGGIRTVLPERIHRKAQTKGGERL